MSIFQPIKFQAEEPQVEIKGPKTITFTRNLGIIQKLTRKYDEEIQNILRGTSEFRHGALHLEKGTCPALEVLKRFKADPNIKDLADFFTLSAQDFGIRVGKTFESWAANVFDSGEFAPPTPIPVSEKNHAAEISRHLYDILKRVGTPVSPEDLSAFTASNEKLARAIDEAVISRCEKLQKAVLAAFDHLETRIKALENPPTAWKTDGTPYTPSPNPDMPVKPKDGEGTLTIS